MSKICSACQRIVEFTGEPPPFCAYCGRAFHAVPLEATAEYHSEIAPQAPADATSGEAGSVPQAVGNYRLLRPLGQGGMGTVFEAEENGTGRRVAVKLLAPELAAASDAVERFRQEGRLASAIAHPRCVFVLAVDEDGGRPYIVMELMNGSTLKDLVEHDGPLAPEQAVAKILDVIEGLVEAHRCGLVHRDVKPSNCFLEPDGRVKIGDFGLSKSLVSDAQLTRTGAFLGTPLFAAPEQIKRDRVDQQSDVYSVAATLYYLLTGQAPHQQEDAAATMARIVSEPAPPVRSRQPQVPAPVDRVVLRGLERDRSRRWRDLEEFRTALLPFLPSQLSIGGVSLRLAAFLIDFTPYMLLDPEFLLGIFPPVHALDAAQRTTVGTAAAIGVNALWIAYFTVLEGTWGCSLGKRLLRLRVHCVAGGKPPGLGKVLFRTLVHFALVMLGPALFWQLDAFPYVLVGLLWLLLGTIILALPMRSRNGYRGLHDWLSGTRVVRLPWPERRRPLRSRHPDRLVESLTQPADMPERLGPFVVRGALRWGTEEKVLLAEDADLGRKVLIRFRPLAAAPLDPRRRDLARPTRLRWLTGDQHSEGQWDAFLAPTGCPLADLVDEASPLAWRETRLVLQQLTDELAAAGADEALPGALTVAQVWVQPTGRVQLLDAPWKEPDPAAPPEPTGPGRTLSLLRAVAVLALEGHSLDAKQAAVPKPPRFFTIPLLWLLVTALAGGLAYAVAYSIEQGRLRGPFGLVLVSSSLLVPWLYEALRRKILARRRQSIWAPVPEHASRLLDRLLGAREPHEKVEEVQADLAATCDRPTEANTALRAGHLALLVCCLLPGLLCMLVSSRAYNMLAIDHLTRNIDNAERALQIAADDDTLRNFVGKRMEWETGDAGVDREFLVKQLRAGFQRDLVEAKLERDRHELESQLQATSWLEKVMASDDLQAARRALDRDQPLEPDDLTLVDFGLVTYRALPGQPKEVDSPEVSGLWTVLLFWPLLWVLWAFLWRGGLTYRLTGLSLILANGHRALRLQCAWRALLVWAPVTALLSGSFWLATRSPASAEVASIMWYLVIALLLGYVVLALWFPRRGLHDCLAGTYLVPR